MSKESYDRGLGRRFDVELDVPDESRSGGAEIIRRPGKTQRDKLSGSWGNRFSNRAARDGGASPKAGKKARSGS